MPVIIATWEANIRRIAVQGQPRQIVLETLFPNNQNKVGWKYGSGYNCFESLKPRFKP
jgi:hypothetical protein